VTVAFARAPGTPRLVCANAARRSALSEAAFGGTRSNHDGPAERDFHDADLLVAEVAEVEPPAAT
jgi:hypothetical protein